MDLEIFENMDASDLRRYLHFLLWHYRVVDAFWYLNITERFDESTDRVEAVFVLGIDNFEDLSKCKNDLKSLSHALTISFFDNRAVI